MEHYKSRNNDFFHFTNPHDDRSELDDDDDDYDELQYCDVDDDRSCDFSFHTYRPLRINTSARANSQTSGVMNRKDTVELGTFDNRALILLLDSKMKNISDTFQHTVEGIVTRISRLNDETCKLDKDVEDVKNSEERYHGTTHKKFGQMQNILQEVQDDVLFLRDKHEIAETKLQLSKLQGSKKDKTTVAQTNPQQQLPLPAPQSSAHDISITPFLNQLPSNVVTLSQAVSQHPVVSQAPEITFQQYVIPPNQQYQMPHRSKENPQVPYFTQSYKSNSFQGVVTDNQSSLSHASEETPNRPSYNYSSAWDFTQEHEVGLQLPQSTHLQSSRNYKSEFHAKYMPEFASFSNIHHHGERPSSYELSNVKPVEFSLHPKEESSRSNDIHIPVAKVLPHALPTAIDVEDESRSKDNGNSISIDDIIDNVTAMGFRRDVVKTCVRKLTANGSQVDLNAVLDKMMNK